MGDGIFQIAPTEEMEDRMNEFIEWYLNERHHLWPRNVWCGISVTSQATTPRIAALWSIRQMIKLRLASTMPTFFVSYGPALESVNFNSYEDAFDWMIIEGESGRGDTAMLETETVLNTLAWCRMNGIAPFVKQMGTRWAQQTEADSFHFKGGDVNAWPEQIRVREMPKG